MCTHLPVQALTKQGFAPFGDVVEAEGAQHFPINQGFAERFNDLAKVDVGHHGGLTNFSIVKAKHRTLPVALTLMERHPLGSQIFYPLQDAPWFVVVCSEPADPATYRAFRATGNQGVNYARGVWHHPLLVLSEPSCFIIVDRKGQGSNLDEVSLPKHQLLYLAT